MYVRRQTKKASLSEKTPKKNDGPTCITNCLLCNPQLGPLIGYTTSGSQSPNFLVIRTSILRLSYFPCGFREPL